MYAIRGRVRFVHKRRLLKHTTLMGTQTCTRQLVLDQHNKSQSYRGLLKLHLVSKLNLRKRKTKSLSGWKLKSWSSENLTIRPETLTKALQIITHMVCFTTHCQKLGTRWRLRVRTKAIMAANSYKKMYGDKETCSNISIMSLRVFGARLETC